MKCPTCFTEIDNEHTNIQTDVALCQNCNLIFRISESIEETIADSFDINSPPDGTWLRNEINHIVLGATTRSVVAFFLVPFMMVWSGFSLGMLYGPQIISGEFNLFTSLFGIPFVLGSILFWGITLMTIGGKVEIILDKNGGNIFTGLGIIGINKKFTWDEISVIRENKNQFNYRGSQGASIILEGTSRISFGKGLSETRRYFLYLALKNFYSKIKANKSF